MCKIKQGGERKPGETDPIMRYEVILASTIKATRALFEAAILSDPE